MHKTSYNTRHQTVNLGGLRISHPPKRRGEYYIWRKDIVGLNQSVMFSGVRLAGIVMPSCSNNLWLSFADDMNVRYLILAVVGSLTTKLSFMPSPSEPLSKCAVQSRHLINKDSPYYLPAVCEKTTMVVDSEMVRSIANGE